MLILALLFSLFFTSFSKVVENSLLFNIFRNDTSEAIAQFITGNGRGFYSLKVWNEHRKKESPMNEEIELNFKVLSYDEWKNSKSKICSNFQENEKNIKLSVPLDGKEVSISNSLEHQSLSQSWVFILEECQGKYKEQMFKGNKIKYHLEIKNSDGSHFSEEENGILSVLTWTLIPLILFLLFQSKGVIEFYYQKTAIDYPILMLTFALFLEFLAVLVEFLHLFVYSKNGTGLFVLDYANVALTHLSQFTISILFVLMSDGWTVKPLRKKDQEILIGFGVMTGIIVCAMSFTSKDSVDEVENYHDYQTWAGKVLIIIKLLMYYLFLTQLIPNYKDSDSPKLQKHYKRLGIFGSCYLLSLPLAVIIAELFLPYVVQHKIITIASIVIQSATLLVYTFYLSSKENESYPIYYKNNRFVSAAKMI